MTGMYRLSNPSVLAAGGHNAFPGLARLVSGRLVLVWRYGATHTSLDGVIKMIRSDDDGVTWTEPVTVLSAPGLDYRDPALMPLSDGRLSMVMFPSNTGGTMGVHVTYSDDDGATWTPLEKLPFGWVYNGGGSSGPMVELEKGQLWVAGYIRDQGRTYRSAYVIHSLDNGATWQPPEIVADGDVEGTHREEPFLGRLNDGRLMLDVRDGASLPGTPSRKRFIRQANGVWSEPVTVTTRTQARPAWLQLSNGRIVVADRLLSATGRDVGVYAVEENVVDPVWSWSRLANDPHETRNTYTQMVELGGGVVGVAFCHEWLNSDSRLHFARLVPDSPTKCRRSGAFLAN